MTGEIHRFLVFILQNSQISSLNFFLKWKSATWRKSGILAFKVQNIQQSNITNNESHETLDIKSPF